MKNTGKTVEFSNLDVNKLKVSDAPTYGEDVVRVKDIDELLGYTARPGSDVSEGQAFSGYKIYAPTNKPTDTNAFVAWNGDKAVWRQLNAGSSNSFVGIFAPTVAGAAGQVLFSKGSGAPEWGSIPIYIGTTCVSSSDSQFKEIGISNFNPSSPAIFQVTFAYPTEVRSSFRMQFSTPTITTAIFYRGAATSSSNSWVAGETVTFIYYPNNGCFDITPAFTSGVTLKSSDASGWTIKADSNELKFNYSSKL